MSCLDRRFLPVSWCALVCIALVLLGCASSEKHAELAPLQKQALAAETDGATRYAHGDYAASIRSFAEAARLQQSLDDVSAVERNRLHLAHAELALGHAQDALVHGASVTDAALQPQALLLQAQAALALNRVSQAQAHLAKLEPLCGQGCTHHSSMQILLARVALAKQDAAQALVHAQLALTQLNGQHEEREIANAWRLVAGARAVLGDYAGAMSAVDSALAIDRQLALPEKIARDWLLVGDIARHTDTDKAKAAYQRALDIATASGQNAIVRLAAEALQENVK